MTRLRSMLILPALLALLTLAPATVMPTASACPNCKDLMAERADLDPATRAELQKQAGLGRGLSYSVLFMMSVPFILVSGFAGTLWWTTRRRNPGNPTA